MRYTINSGWVLISATVYRGTRGLLPVATLYVMGTTIQNNAHYAAIAQYATTIVNGDYVVLSVSGKISEVPGQCK
jgi:hypothetical protein